MKQLSGMDNLFLALETPDQYLHIAGMGIYDPTSATGDSISSAAVLDFFIQRLSSAKLFRRRLLVPRFGLDRPLWIETDIDIDDHLHHVVLPAPGDWRQLMHEVARVHEQALDLHKPLWEAYLIEGLVNVPGCSKDAFALYVKFHHAAIDGEASAVLLKVLHSTQSTPLAADDPATQADRVPVRERMPGAMRLYLRAIENRARQMRAASSLMLSLSGRAAGLGKEFIASGRALAAGKHWLASHRRRSVDAAVAARDRQAQALDAALQAPPHTRFDKPLSAQRVIDSVGLSIADSKKIRQRVGQITINDILLATVGGALRQYLSLKGELPDASLNALMPMTTRGDFKDVDAGNQLSMTAVALRTDIADPVVRVRAVRRSNSAGQAHVTALGKDMPARLIQVLPARVSTLLLRRMLLARINVIVSNVRGPAVPLYMAGAKLQTLLPISTILSGVGLTLTGFSYNGTLQVCFVACRRILPDPELFARCLERSFADLLAAALALPQDGASTVDATQAERDRDRKLFRRVRGRRAAAPDAGAVSAA